MPQTGIQDTNAAMPHIATNAGAHGPILRPSRPRVALAFAAVYVIWGSTYLAIRFGLETIPPFFLAGIRFTIAGTALYWWMRWHGVASPSKAQWRAAAIIGALLFLLGNGALTWSELRVPSGVASLLVSTLPIWMVLITHAQQKARHQTVRLGKRVMAGLAVGLAGVSLLIGPSNVLGHGGVDGIGATVLLLGSMAWTLGSIYSPKVGLPQSTMMAAAMEMICGGVMLILLGIVTGETRSVRIDAISARSILGLIYLITFGSWLGFTSYNWLLTHSTPARVSTYAYVNPVVAVFLGWAIAGETVSTRTLTAAALVVAAVALIITHREHAPTPQSDMAPSPPPAPEDQETPLMLPLD
ncbi:MAG TPA: EamA family transporter [Terriglobia bacterium]|nr:EamA family transporter [Terriglobia bacterium]